MNKKKAKRIICALRKNDNQYVGTYRQNNGDYDVVLRTNREIVVLTRKDAKLFAKRINEYLEATK
jgi:hypothetical protein